MFILLRQLEDALRALKQYIDSELLKKPVIDDTAGIGDTDRTWSADKIMRELSNMNNNA